MARLRDVPRAVRSVGPVAFVKMLAKRVADDDLTTQAAAVAYAWLFAVFPFLIFLLTLLYYLPERRKADAQGLITTAINRVVERDAAAVLVDNLHQVFQPHGGLLSLGLAVTLWVASGGMSTTMTCLDTAYNARRRRPFWVQRPLAILLTAITSASVVTVVVLLPVGSAVTTWAANARYFPERLLPLFDVVRLTVAVMLVLMFLSLLYQFGTVVRHRFTFVSPGALFTLVVWFLLGTGFRIYVERLGNYQKTYGTIGGVFILLLFFYLDALVLLVGAEINSQVEECAKAAKQPTLFEPEPVVAQPLGE